MNLNFEFSQNFISISISDKILIFQLKLWKDIVSFNFIEMKQKCHMCRSKAWTAPAVRKMHKCREKNPAFNRSSSGTHHNREPFDGSVQSALQLSRIFVFRKMTKIACFATGCVTQRSAYQSLANSKSHRLVYVGGRRKFNVECIKG